MSKAGASRCRAWCRVSDGSACSIVTGRRSPRAVARKTATQWGQTLRVCPLVAQAARRSELLACSLVGQHVAKQLPGLTLESCQPHRLDGIEIRGAGVDFDARQ